MQHALLESPPLAQMPADPTEEGSATPEVTHAHVSSNFIDAMCCMHVWARLEWDNAMGIAICCCLLLSAAVTAATC